MNRPGALVLAALLLLALPPVASRAEVPSYMHFQGVLTDDAGLPLNETVDMVFRLYADTTQASIWSDTYIGVAVVNGFYEVILDVETLDFSLPYFVGIEVEGSSLGPKKPLATVPYSQRSGKVRVTAGDGLAGTSDSMGVCLSIAGSGVTGEMIADGAVIESKIGNGSVTEGKVADGSIAEAKLGTAAVSGEKIAPNTVVRSINGLTDSVTLVAGSQITISSLAGDTIEISASVSGEASDDDWVVDGNDMHSQPSGNVGIGTATPAEKLHVTGGSIRTDGVFISSVGAGTPPAHGRVDVVGGESERRFSG